MKRVAAAVAVLAAAACAQPSLTQPAPAAADSVVPGTIGVSVRSEQSSVVVAAVGKGSPGERSGLRVGDVVLRLNGEPVLAPRDFYRRVVDSPPGSAARLELLRDGRRVAVDVPVRELDTAPRG